MRRLTGEAVWLGHAGDLRELRTVMDNGIEAVIEVADNEPLALLPRELVRLRFPLPDGGDNPSWLLTLAAESVAALVRAGVPTLLCCSAGMSRSVCVAAAGLALVRRQSFAESLKAITATGPADVSPRLAAQFQQVLGH